MTRCPMLRGRNQGSTPSRKPIQHFAGRNLRLFLPLKRAGIPFRFRDVLASKSGAKSLSIIAVSQPISTPCPSQPIVENRSVAIVRILFHIRYAVLCKCRGGVDPRPYEKQEKGLSNRNMPLAFAITPETGASERPVILPWTAARPHGPSAPWKGRHGGTIAGVRAVRRPPPRVPAVRT